jgi:hypothetical protein
MIEKHDYFQVEYNDRYFVIRMTVDVREWTFFPLSIAKAIEKARLDMMLIHGLIPAPFGVEVI